MRLHEQHAAIFALIVDAKDDGAAAFYEYLVPTVRKQADDIVPAAGNRFVII